MPMPWDDDGRLWLSWTGMETDLIFNKHRALPGFAAFPLLDDAEGRALLAGYYAALSGIAEETGCCAFIDTPTWMANPDRAAAIGWTPEQVDRINREALAFAAAQVGPAGCLSVQLGPRGEGYEAGMESAADAQSYHDRQIDIAAAAGADVISAFTIGSVAEAEGVIAACAAADVPVILSFVVETDGRLATGMALAEAIDRADQATGGSAAYFMVNCAHPDHIAPALNAGPIPRLRGIVANASRCSHAELDEAEVLDDGDPLELAAELAALRQAMPQIKVLGGCCGTDLRHIRAIAQAAQR